MSYNPTSCPNKLGHILTNIVTSCHSLALRVTAETLAVTNDSKGY